MVTASLHKPTFKKKERRIIWAGVTNAITRSLTHTHTRALSLARARSLSLGRSRSVALALSLSLTCRCIRVLPTTHNPLSYAHAYGYTAYTCTTPARHTYPALSTFQLLNRSSCMIRWDLRCRYKGNPVPAYSG